MVLSIFTLFGCSVDGNQEDLLKDVVFENAEIEFDGNIHSFSYYTPLRQDEYIDVAKVIYHEDKTFEHGKLHRSFSNLKDALAGIANRKIEFVLVGNKRYDRKEFKKLCEGNK